MLGGACPPPALREEGEHDALWNAAQTCTLSAMRRTFMSFSSGNSSSRIEGMTGNKFKPSALDLSTGAGARLHGSNPGSAIQPFWALVSPLIHMGIVKHFRGVVQIKYLLILAKDL